VKGTISFLMMSILSDQPTASVTGSELDLWATLANVLHADGGRKPRCSMLQLDACQWTV